jgi:hypothetical protein
MSELPFLSLPKAIRPCPAPSAARVAELEEEPGVGVGVIAECDPGEAAAGGGVGVGVDAPVAQAADTTANATAHVKATPRPPGRAVSLGPLVLTGLPSRARPSPMLSLKNAPGARADQEIRAQR